MWNSYKTKSKKRLVTGALSDQRKFLAADNPLKKMKNAFYFTLKALSFLRYLNVFFDFFVMWKNSSMRKITLISKFLMSQPD